jgi:hypothetical protein
MQTISINIDIMSRKKEPFAIFAYSCPTPLLPGRISEGGRDTVGQVSDLPVAAFSEGQRFGGSTSLQSWESETPGTGRPGGPPHDGEPSFGDAPLLPL